MDSDSFIILSCTGGTLICCGKGSVRRYRFLLETFWCYRMFAARCLVGESRKVYQKLKEDDLPGARRAVSMIVGERHQRTLPAEGVTKAAVETVAENTSDGVSTAPLIFLSDWRRTAWILTQGSEHDGFHAWIQK